MFCGRAMQNAHVFTPRSNSWEKVWIVFILVSHFARTMSSGRCLCTTAPCWRFSRGVKQTSQCLENSCPNVFLQGLQCFFPLAGCGVYITSCSVYVAITWQVTIPQVGHSSLLVKTNTGHQPSHRRYDISVCVDQRFRSQIVEKDSEGFGEEELGGLRPLTISGFRAIRTRRIAPCVASKMFKFSMLRFRMSFVQVPGQKMLIVLSGVDTGLCSEGPEPKIGHGQFQQGYAVCRR